MAPLITSRSERQACSRRVFPVTPMVPSNTNTSHSKKSNDSVQKQAVSPGVQEMAEIEGGAVGRNSHQMSVNGFSAVESSDVSAKSEKMKAGSLQQRIPSSESRGSVQPDNVTSDDGHALESSLEMESQKLQSNMSEKVANIKASTIVVPPNHDVSTPNGHQDFMHQNSNAVPQFGPSFVPELRQANITGAVQQNATFFPQSSGPISPSTYPMPHYPFPLAPQPYGAIPPFVPPEGQMSFAHVSSHTPSHQLHGPSVASSPSVDSARHYDSRPPSQPRGDMEERQPSPFTNGNECHEPCNAPQRGIAHHGRPPRQTHGPNPRFEPRQPSNELSEYLLSEFEAGKYTDSVLILSFPSQGRLSEVRFNLHSVIAARSPTLRSLSICPGKTVRVFTSSPFVKPTSFRFALRNLYGEHPLFSESFANAVAKFGPPNQLNDSHFEEFLEVILGYAASGRVLGLDDLVEWFFPHIIGILNWFSIERIIAFALESLPSSAESHLNGAASRSVSANNSPPSIYQRLLYTCLIFILDHLPPTFVFYPSATSNFIPLLFSSSSHRADSSESDNEMPSVSRNPLLLHMRFGSMPPQATNREDDILSTIFTNLPFEYLQWTIEHWHSSHDTKTLWSSIIAERERRRLWAWEEKKASSPMMKTGQSIDWEERLIKDDGGRFDVIRVSAT